MTSPKKALFIQLRRIGDILMCTPAVRAFKKKYPDCSLDLLTEHPDVLIGNQHVNEIIEVDSSRQFSPSYQYRLIRKLRQSGYDLVVDFLANPRSAYYTFLTGAAIRLSYGFGHRRWAYNISPPVPSGPIYAAMDKLNLIKAINVQSEDSALEFYPTEKDRADAERILSRFNNNRMITVSPVSRREYRRWPLDRFAEICRRLKAEYGFEILILVGPGEGEFGATLSDMLKNEDSLSLEVVRLGLLGALFEKSLLHIGNDNGPKHIAVASGTPTFAIFGTDDPLSWTYPDFTRHYFISSRDVDPGCRSENHQCGPECIKKITVDAVYEKLTDLISRLRVSNQAPEPR
jgi:heptosyltransferase-3